jgi:cation diffusion facilitator CzcD-associated flavoprotein CzcO
VGVPDESEEIVAADVDVDVLVVGAGITGIYQLYRAREAGFSVKLLEAGGGVGGTWYWNRYPGARFDSESYTYAYLFSRELFDEWAWQEHFAEQPETERYLNHVVDRFDLRRHIRFDAKVTSAVYHASSGTWTVVVGDGTEFRTRFLIAATGVLSVPYFPEVAGREDFRGESHHTGLWPDTTVDFAGKRVAVIGTGSSGVQIIPAIAGEVASLTVYQRSANWCTPLNNAPITPDEQARLRADFEAIRETLNTSHHGFLHRAHDRATFDDPEEERRAFFEKMWNSPGFSKLSSNYTDLLLDPAANAQWCEFLTEKILGIVEDPETAKKLIPKDRDRDRDGGRCARVRHRRVGDRLRLRHRRAQAYGDPRPARPRARGLLGRRSEDVPRGPDCRVPELLLPRRAARRGGQQPAVQRRPGGVHHRDAHIRARPRL